MQQDKVDKRNFILNIFRGASWGLGCGFVVESTIMVIFLTHFTDSKVIIALLATIPALAGAIIPIISEYFTKHIQRKKKLISLLVLFSQLCWLGIAVFTFLSGSLKPASVLIIFFVLYAVSSVIIGIMLPINYALQAKIIPPKKGAFLGLGSTFSGLFAVAGAIFAKSILENYSFPTNFALCFLLAFIIRTANIAFVMASVEKEIPITQADNKFHVYLKELFELIKNNKKYRDLLIVQILVSLSAMGTVFYTLYVQSVIDMTPSVIGMITIFAIIGGMLGSLVSGFLGDVKGHRLIYAIALGGEIITVAIALFGKTTDLFYFMFFLAGVSGAAASIACSAIIIEMAPMELNGRYFAVNTTVLAPFAALAPVIGGLLIDKTSYVFVFCLTIIFLFAGLILFLKSKQDPLPQKDVQN